VTGLAKRKRKSKDSNKLGFKDLVLPVAGFILSALLILSLAQVATQNGWTFPGINIPPIQFGNNGSTITGGGTIPGGGTAAVIPTGVLSFKMALVANYEDNTQEVLYEKSTLPFNLIQIHGKVVRRVDAQAIAAIALDEALPSDAQAHFMLNFSAWIGRLNVSRWIYRDMYTPLIQNGTMALAMLPTFSVLSTDVFPTAPVCRDSGGNQIGCPAENRQVIWTVDATVEILNAQGQKLLSLIGNTLSSATFNLDGSLDVCTDCGGSSTPGGVDFTPGGAHLDLPDPCDRAKPPSYCNPTSPPPPPGTTKPEPGTTQEGPISETKSQSKTTISYVYTVAITGTVTSRSMSTFYVTSGCLYGGSGCVTQTRTATNTKTATNTQDILVVGSRTEGEYTGGGISYSEISGQTDTGAIRIINHDADGNPTGTDFIEPNTRDSNSGGGWQAAGGVYGSEGARPPVAGGTGPTPLTWLWDVSFGTETYRINVWAIIVASLLGSMMVGCVFTGYWIAVRRMKHK
jgi:hypothetical protein